MGEPKEKVRAMMIEVCGLEHLITIREKLNGSGELVGENANGNHLENDTACGEAA